MITLSMPGRLYLGGLSVVNAYQNHHLLVSTFSQSLYPWGSRVQACRRYYQNQLSLQRRGKYEDFTKALEEYGELGHAEPVPACDLQKPDSKVFYLPAHGVVDASAKTTSGISLNDILLPGINLYPLITDVVLFFRTHVIGMSADISKMFREVGLHPDDRDLHRFLQPGLRGEGITDMRMTRVTFGVTSSPFLATQVLRQLAKDYKEQYPQAAKIILACIGTHETILFMSQPPFSPLMISPPRGRLHPMLLELSTS